VSDISETLREQQGRHQVAQKENRNSEPYGVLYAHNRSTPLTISEASAKNAMMRITKPRSDIFVALQSSGGLFRHPVSLYPACNLKQVF
jgi:hypothetical protein